MTTQPAPQSNIAVESGIRQSGAGAFMHMPRLGHASQQNHAGSFNSSARMPIDSAAAGTLARAEGLATPALG